MTFYTAIQENLTEIHTEDSVKILGEHFHLSVHSGLFERELTATFYHSRPSYGITITLPFSVSNYDNTDEHRRYSELIQGIEMARSVFKHYKLNSLDLGYRSFIPSMTTICKINETMNSNVSIKFSPDMASYSATIFGEEMTGRTSDLMAGFCPINENDESYLNWLIHSSAVCTEALEYFFRSLLGGGNGLADGLDARDGYNAGHYMGALAVKKENPEVEFSRIKEVMFPKKPSIEHRLYMNEIHQNPCLQMFSMIAANRVPFDVAKHMYDVELKTNDEMLFW